jgi:hypothetical protein
MKNPNELPEIQTRYDPALAQYLNHLRHRVPHKEIGAH